MKKALIITAICLITAVGMYSATTADQKVTLKGNLSISNKSSPEFKSNWKDYMLLMPMHLLTTDMKDGDQSDIEGYVISKDLVTALGMYGLSLLKWIKETGLNIPVIMISAYQDVKDAIEAMKLGAKDYIVKPFDPEELVIRLKRMIDDRNIKSKVEAGILTNFSNKFIGESKKILEIKKIIDKVAKTRSNVLITGESGTGKEVVAKMIHDLSGINEKPFVAVNLGGIPENLIESELFGYEKGAFTGADTRKVGIFETAKEGTLFLDEIGDMPLHLQVKLLRVLQDRKIQRLGSIQQIPINSRIISATNKNLLELIKENKFREDLYFRLNIISIELPPLRERTDDIPILTGYFINKFNKIMDKNIIAISKEALDKLTGYQYKGNIRELENIIERAFIFCEGDIISPDNIDIKDSIENTFSIGKMKDIEKQTIVDTLKRWDNNQTKASKELGFTRRTLFNKIKEYRIQL